MPNTVISIDLGHAPEEQRQRPHNRWHPEIPAVVTVESEDIFRVECLDATGGQILNSDVADDVRDLDLTQVLYASGPIAVAGARPGDVLAVDILDVGLLSGAEWGYTALLDHAVGAGLLSTDHPHPRKAIWDINGVFATSRHIGGVRLTGTPHPALLGCAPSAEMLSRWNARERGMRESPADPFTALVGAPDPHGALLGGTPREIADRLTTEAARTWAARETGGNLDVKELTPGSRAFFPVHVAGANLSVGDLQFSQGDGKINGFGGVKMSGWIDLQVRVLRDGVSRYGMTSPTFEPRSGAACETIAFQGVAVGEDGGPRYRDVWLAFADAYREAIRHLERFGYSSEQAYALLSAAPVEEKLTGSRGHPNVCCTVMVPIDIFEFDARITAEGVRMPRGELARPS